MGEKTSTRGILVNGWILQGVVSPTEHSFFELGPLSQCQRIVGIVFYIYNNEVTQIPVKQ